MREYEQAADDYADVEDWDQDRGHVLTRPDAVLLMCSAWQVCLYLLNAQVQAGRSGR